MRRFTSVRLLKEGMIIDQSIIDATGRILVAKGIPLEGYHIEGLRSLNIGGVYITDGKDQEAKLITEISPSTQKVIERLQVDDKASVALTESVKKRVSEGIQFLYSNPQAEGFTQAANSISDELMQAINENDAVVVDINVLKISDEYTFKHSVDVASIAMVIAKQMGMPEEQVREIGMAGILHDLGKSQIPPEILNKPGRLTDEEFHIMKQHSLYGYNMLKDKDDIPREILMGVLQHHEKINGKGYPLGLTDRQIFKYARILSVADIYDALVTERPYKAGFSPRDAVEMIMAMTAELDVSVINSFLDSVLLYPVGSLVQLSNGDTGKVVENNHGQPMRPKVVGLKAGKVYDLANDTKCANVIII